VALEEIRSGIDALDEQIVTLLAARQKLVTAAARYKSETAAVRAPARRAAVMQRLHHLALQKGASPELVRRVYTEMIDAFIELELHTHQRINTADN
jgi:isochorismate pyruvate lyase